MDISELSKHPESVWRQCLQEFNKEKIESDIIDILDTSFRLRRIPETIQALIFVLTNDFHSLKRKNITFPDSVGERFAIYCQELPPSQVITLWNIFSNGISGKLLSHFDGKLGGSRLLKIMADLFMKLIMNTKLMEHNIQQLESELQIMAQSTLSPLLQLHLQIPQDTELTKIALSLAFVWGEVSMILQQYCDKNLLKVENLDFEGANLKFVHYYFDEWNTLHSNVVADPSSNLHYHYALLLLQKIRAVHQFGSHLGIDARSSLQKTLSLLLKLARKSLKAENADGRQNICIALFKHIHVLVPLWEEKTLLGVIRHLFDILSLEQHRPMKTHAQKILASEYFSELTSVHSMLITAFFEKLSAIPGFNDSPSHLKILEELSSDFESWILEDNTTPRQSDAIVWKKLNEVAITFNEIFSSSQHCDLSNTQLKNYLEGFECLPLSSLLPANQTRCIFGIIAILTAFDVSKLNSEQNHLILLCERLLRALSSGFRTPWSYELLSGSLFLKWYTGFIMKLSTVVAKDQQWLRVQSSTACFSLFSKRILANRCFINQLAPFVEFIQKLGTVKKLKKMSDEEIEIYFTISKVVIQLFVNSAKNVKNTKTKEEFKKFVGPLSNAVVSCAAERLTEDTSTQMMKCFLDVLEISVNNPTTNDISLSPETSEKIKKILKQLNEKYLTEQDDASLEICATVLAKNFVIVSTFTPELTQTIWDRSRELHERELQLQNCSLLHSIENLMAKIVEFSTVKSFQAVILPVMRSVMVNDITSRNQAGVCSGLRIWQIMTNNVKHEEKQVIFNKTCGQLLSFIPHLVNKFDKSNAKYSSFLVAVMTLIVDILHSTEVNFEHIPFHLFVEFNFEDNLDVEKFAEIHLKYYNVVDYVFRHHSSHINQIVPVLYSCVSVLMREVIRRSDQNFIKSVTREMPFLKECALNLGRLFQRFKKWEKELNRIAPYLIADFVSLSQERTILPAVKEILTSAIYEIVDLCDEFSTAVLKSNLAHTSSELFKELHSNFLKYHKFTGKV